MKEKTPIFTSISELNNSIPSEHKDLSATLGKLRKNLLIDSNDDFQKKLPTVNTVLSLELDRYFHNYKKDIELINTIIHSSRFTGPKYNQESTNLFKHKVFFIHHDQELTNINIIHQEGYDSKINDIVYDESLDDKSFNSYSSVLNYAWLHEMKVYIAKERDKYLNSTKKNELN